MVIADNNYEFLTTLYDKEEIRKLLLSLKAAGIDCKLVERSNSPSARAPLSAYVEVDILVNINDFQPAMTLLEQQS